jgi:prephenate dehydratase
MPVSIARFGGMSGMGDGGAQAGRSDKLELWEMEDRSAILLTLADKPGILNKALNIITANGINMTAINSRPPKLLQNNPTMDFNIDFYGTHDEPKVKKCMLELRQLSIAMT